MLLEDKIEPLCREIAHFLVLTGASAGTSWEGYKRGEDLRPRKRSKDDAVDFQRAENWQARLAVYDIREQEPAADTVVIHPEIVLSSKRKFGATVVIDNYNSDSPSGEKIMEIEFDDGETEADALSTSMTNETWATASAKVEAEVGPAKAEASVESGWKNTIELAWSKQTGRSRHTKVAFTSKEFAPPHTKLSQRLEWNEQTKQRRVECDSVIDFGFSLGRRSKRGGKWGWNTKSPVKWDSIDHLIAVAEKRGSVKHARYEHFSRRDMSEAERGSLERIKELRKVHIDRLTEPYPGNADIRIVIVDLDSRDEENAA